MNIPAELAIYICENSYGLAIAEFTAGGRLIQANKGFQLLFSGMTFENKSWNDFFLVDIPAINSAGSIQEQKCFKTTADNELNGWLCKNAFTFHFIGEIYEVGDKHFLEEISDLTNVMANLNSKLRHDKQCLIKATKELENLSRKDPLTNLLNRRAFFNVIEEKLSLATRQGIAITLCYIDLDHFKSVNDNWGHDIGDALLIKISTMLKETIRLEDVAARFGGEEFIVVLIGLSLDKSRLVAERIREQCKQIHINSLTRSNTLSIGIATWDGVENIQSLITRADHACYTAKNNGRDCCVVANVDTIY